MAAARKRATSRKPRARKTTTAPKAEVKDEQALYFDKKGHLVWGDPKKMTPKKAAKKTAETEKNGK